MQFRTGGGVEWRRRFALLPRRISEPKLSRSTQWIWLEPYEERVSFFDKAWWLERRRIGEEAATYTTDVTDYG